MIAHQCFLDQCCMFTVYMPNTSTYLKMESRYSTIVSVISSLFLSVATWTPTFIHSFSMNLMITTSIHQRRDLHIVLVNTQITAISDNDSNILFHKSDYHILFAPANTECPQAVNIMFCMQEMDIHNMTGELHECHWDKPIHVGALLYPFLRCSIPHPCIPYSSMHHCTLCKVYHEILMIAGYICIMT